MATEITYDELKLKVRKLEKESSKYKQLAKQNLVSAERLQYLFSSTSAVIYTAKATDDYEATFISDNVSQMVGYEPEEFLEDTSFWINHVHPQDALRISGEVHKVFEKEPHAYEYRFKHKNGKYIWVRDEMKLVRGNNGEPLEIIGYWVDVTKQKTAEQNLQKSEKRFREFLDNLADATYETDSEGHVTYANRMSEVITGLSLENIIGKSFLPFFTEESKAIATEVYQRTLNGDSPEYELTFSNGKICHFKNTPLRDDNGKIIGVFGIAREITERKRMEEAVQESADRYRNLIESSMDGVAIVQGLEMKFVNSALVKMFGFQNEEEMTGRKFTEFVSPLYRNLMTQMGFDREKGKETPGRYEFKALRKDGSEFDAEISVSTISYGKGYARQGIVRDVTTQKQAEEALKNSHDHLERRVRERTVELELTNEKLKQEIEKHKQTGETLRESEATARALLNAPIDIMLLSDLDGTIIDINESGVKNFERSRNELIGICAFDLFPPDVSERRKAMTEKVINSKKPKRFLDQRNGKWFDQQIYPILNLQGEVPRLAIYIRDISEMKQIEEALRTREKELEEKTLNLEDINIALKVLLKRREQDKEELEERLLLNVKELVEPYLEKLKNSELTERQKIYADILQSNLNDITSSFMNKLSSRYLKLTPTEIQIANLIKQGRRTKEIADLLNLSTRTIKFHRENIRKKIGIRNNKANLRSRLLSLQ